MGGSVRRIRVVNQAGDCLVGDSAEEDRDNGCSAHYQKDGILTRFWVPRFERECCCHHQRQSDDYRRDVRRDANQPLCLVSVHSTDHSPLLGRSSNAGRQSLFGANRSSSPAMWAAIDWNLKLLGFAAGSRIVGPLLIRGSEFCALLVEVFELSCGIRAGHIEAIIPRALGELDKTVPALSNARQQPPMLRTPCPPEKVRRQPKPTRRRPWSWTPWSQTPLCLGTQPSYLMQRSDPRNRQGRSPVYKPQTPAMDPRHWRCSHPKM